MKVRKLFRKLRAPEIVLAVFVFVALGLLFQARILDLYEDIAYRIDPSPERALSYGERHLDATNPAEYDIDRAEYFFNLAAAKNPTLPYLYHELARISFLEGNFTVALAQINFQISLHGDSEPNSYYMRGLIEGYMGDYADAAEDYQHYLQFDPHDWAAINDYAWVLLKAGRSKDAAQVTDAGLQQFPYNPWLLNTNSIAHYEDGDLKGALATAQQAVATAQEVTESAWLTAYPGNDPRAASEGIAALQQAALDNMHTIQAAIASSTIQ